MRTEVSQDFKDERPARIHKYRLKYHDKYRIEMQKYGYITESQS